MNTKHLTLITITGLIWLGCGNNENPKTQCNFDGDCVQKFEKCDKSANQCITLDVPECAKQADCPAIKSCQLPAGICVLPQKDPDMGKMDMTVSEDMNTSMDMSGSKDMGKDMKMTGDDTTPPNVFSVEPAQLNESIDPDQEFVVTFSEPVDPISISEFSILLKDSQNTTVETDLTLSASNSRLSIKPKTNLAPASGYTLIIKTFVRDLALNNLDKEYTYNYITEFKASAEHTALAQKWGPYIYQGIEDDSGRNWRRDMPTNLDFDGDFKANNNKENALLANSAYRARVYYHVTTSQTHHFIYYIMYYPTRTLTDVSTGNDVQYEHDNTGAVFVVERATNKLVIVEGVRVEENTDQLISYSLQGSGYNAPGETIRRSFKQANLEDTTHYPFYVPAKRHEACNWHDPEPRSPLDLCKHPRAEFPGGKSKGVILKPGAASSYETAMPNSDGIKEMTYELIPMASAYWLRRNNVGADTLFASGFVYKPEAMRQAGLTENGPPHLLPTKLASDDTNTFGKTPFQWLLKGAKNNAGQWMIDPAYELRQRYVVPGMWSLDYCENLFLNIKTTCPN